MAPSGASSAPVAGADVRRAVPPLHLVTDDEVLARPGFLARAAEALEAGGERVALHLRGPRMEGARLFGLSTALVPLARAAGALLLVNDRLDVALAAQADGAQVGARGIHPADARRMLGAERWLGVSVHGRDEADAAAGGAPDLLLAGTLYPTASHPGRAGAGPALLASLADLGVPRVAIGGITPERVGEVAAAGAAGVAVLRGVWEAERVGEAVEAYLAAWEASSGPGGSSARGE
jgi:thiamine-phosphate pyrophosphorylase